MLFFQSSFLNLKMGRGAVGKAKEDLHSSLYPYVYLSQFSAFLRKKQGEKNNAHTLIKSKTKHISVIILNQPPDAPLPTQLFQALSA